ncbi:MAG: hypothetical protein ACXAC7_02550 [Candidatus Hodarchaeales archaeon]|jgi:hypothetical protein
MIQEGSIDQWEAQYLFFIAPPHRYYRIEDLFQTLYEVVSHLISFSNQIGRGANTITISPFYQKGINLCLQGLYHYRITSLTILQFFIELQHIASIQSLLKPKSLRFYIGQLMTTISSLQFLFLEHLTKDLNGLNTQFHFKRFKLLSKTYLDLLNIGNYLSKFPETPLFHSELREGILNYT